MPTLPSVVTRGLLRRAVAPAAAAGLAVALAACESVTELNETSPTFVSPSTFYRNDAQAQTAVNGIYEPLLSWNMWRAPSQNAVMCEDNEMSCQNWQGGGFSGNQAGQWYVSRLYTGNYQIIQRANDVITNVSKSEGITAATKRLSIGQALFARGYAYFDLVRTYGGVPLRLEPYKPEATLGDLPRATVAETYQQAAKDLRAAADSLEGQNANTPGQGRPRAATAWGMLAKVYLHMAGDELTGTPLAGAKAAYNDSARTAAARAVALVPGELPNYVSLFDVSTQNGNPEVLFAVQGSAASSQGSEIAGAFAPRGDCTLAGGCGQGSVTLREDFYQTFERGDRRLANDVIARAWTLSAGRGRYPRAMRGLHNDSIATLARVGLVARDTVVASESWNEGCATYGLVYRLLATRNAANPAQVLTDTVATVRQIQILKYTDPKATTSSTNSNNFNILRLADVLLVQAEAENEVNGPTLAAYAAINRVRARASLAPLAGLSKEQFRQAVWAERSHELFGEFQARHDLIREGRWMQVMNAPSTIPDYAAHGVCRPRQAFQKLLPLPNSELAGNSLIKQNPGY